MHNMGYRRQHRGRWTGAFCRRRTGRAVLGFLRFSVRPRSDAASRVVTALVALACSAADAAVVPSGGGGGVGGCSSSASVAGAVVGHTGQRMDAQDGYNMTLCYSHGAADGHVALAAPRRGGRGQSEAEAAAEAASAGASMVPPDAQGTVRQVRAAVVAGLPPQAGEGASTSAALRTETMGLQSEAGAAAEAATCSRHPAARGARRICRQRARRTQASARGAPTRSAVALAEPTAHAPVRPSSGGGWVAHIHAHAYI